MNLLVEFSGPETTISNTPKKWVVTQQLQPEVLRPAQPTPQVPIVTSSKIDPIREIRKKGAKEFLGDKGDDPIVAEQCLSHLCRVIKEMKCTAE
ncbi:hypothetical protein J1N35_041431 [Gossypium stocksii]|uniref:Uncharacterized protein n=1 Tax=Gossypium stocksii TaxID=47602 RepID=A0A9D3ZJD4_9ROSI|nr:hypothetical protein J1N35_041431 [Gossypium stocksii]